MCQCPRSGYRVPIKREGHSIFPQRRAWDQTLKPATVVCPTFYNNPSHQSRKCGVLFRIISHPSSCRPSNRIIAHITRPLGLAHGKARCCQLWFLTTLPHAPAFPCAFLSSATRLKKAETTSALAVYCCRTNCPTHGSRKQQ